mgnify:CR=1 FL=1
MALASPRDHMWPLTRGANDVRELRGTVLVRWKPDKTAARRQRDRVKRLYGLAGADETRRHFNQLFRPTARELPEYRRLRLLAHYARRHDAHPELYLSYVNLGAAGDEVIIEEH